jgi:hypothetical protein
MFDAPAKTPINMLSASVNKQTGVHARHLRGLSSSLTHPLGVLNQVPESSPFLHPLLANGENSDHELKLLTDTCSTSERRSQPRGAVLGG